MLIWDFYREVSPNASPGAVVHYFDEQSQSLYIKNGLVSRTAAVPEGHWRQAAPSEQAAISAAPYRLLAVDHPANGVLYMAAVDGDNLVYLRYSYAMDLSHLCRAGSWQEQVDNQIKQLSLEVRNVSPETFAAENTIFNPGARVSLSFTAGDSEPYPIGTVYLDEMTYDAYADTIPISGRNAIGYFLASQTFDDLRDYSGSRAAVFAAILSDAGVRDFIVQPDFRQITLQFDSNNGILNGMNDALAAINWRMTDTPNDGIVVGSDAFLASHISNSRYVFNGGSEVFRRQTRKSADAAYARVCVRDRDGNHVYRDVPHWARWRLGARKTQYYDAPEGYTPAQMSVMANDLALQLQYVGIGEEFSSPLRPQLIPGDIAEIFYAGETKSTSLGLITEVSHSFGESGFTTSFSLDSGGVATDAEDYAVVSRAAMLDGYNRRQRVLDLVGIASERKAIKVYAGGGAVIIYSAPAEALSITEISTMRIL